ncbi:MAG: type II toxin-antitoxin system YafQ family toxin [Candidatus Symbiobacter sp.]|nr:type II toxin-antitoxin system YafQ family toxin [Candidatus Symbiobacter sp.]
MIIRSTQFRRDYRRIEKGRYKHDIDRMLAEIIIPLAQDIPLAAKFHDHALTGKWSGYRECHLRPDLLLIYEKPNKDTMELTRMGSHSELGLG